MFEGWRGERRIRKVLAGLARQRVALVLQPGNVWVIERALQRDEETEALLYTCHMRGWIEPLHDGIPTGDLPDDLSLPNGPPFTNTQTLYRLTEGGWSALNRAHAWTLASVLIAVASLVATVVLAT